MYGPIFCLLPVEIQTNAALGDPPVKQPACHWRNHQQCNRHTARRLPEDGDIVGVTTKRCDVTFDPFERLDLIQQPIVTGRLVG